MVETPDVVEYDVNTDDREEVIVTEIKHSCETKLLKDISEGRRKNADI